VEMEGATPYWGNRLGGGPGVINPNLQFPSPARFRTFLPSGHSFIGSLNKHFMKRKHEKRELKEREGKTWGTEKGYKLTGKYWGALKRTTRKIRFCVKGFWGEKGELKYRKIKKQIQ